MSGSAHLVVLIHGLFGSTSNLEVLAEELVATAAAQSAQSSSSLNGGGGGDDSGVGLGTPSQLINERDHRSGSRVGDGHPGTPRRSTRRKGNPDRTGEDQARTTEMSNGAEELAASTNEGRGEERQVVVYNCNSFGWGHTWDGVDVNAERAADEVRKEIERIETDGKQVDHISIIGYSLGGLIARYLIASLQAHDDSFFRRHRPAAFATVATPHLGVLKYGTTTNTIVHTIGRRLFSRTGQQLYCMDKDEEGRCLLEVMADPGGIFIQTLQKFNKVFIFANGCNDLTVPFPTAAISNTDPFADHEAHPFPMTVDEDHVVRSWAPSAHAAAAADMMTASTGQAGSALRTDEYTDQPTQGVPPGFEAAREARMERTSKTEEIVMRDGDVDITVTITRSSTQQPSRTSGRRRDGEAKEGVGKGKEGTIKKRPRYPPVLFARYPYTYLPILFLPLILPLWLCFVTCFMIYQSFKSARRYRLHTSSRVHSRGSSTEKTPLLASAPHSLSSRGPGLRTGPRSGTADLYADSPAPSGTSTPPFHALAMSPSISLSGAPLNALSRHQRDSSIHSTDADRNGNSNCDGEMTDANIVQLLPKPSAPLLLTSRQQDMIYNINTALEGKVERVIAWFPLEFNSHATLIVRNPKVFPNHNQARGILRLLSRKVLEAAA